MTESLVVAARRRFHAGMIQAGLLTTNEKGVASIADSASASSRDISRLFLTKIGNEALGARLAGQTAGRGFEDFVRTFLAEIFPRLSMVRCGDFEIASGGLISTYDQYAHLTAVERAVQNDADLRVAMGRDYIIRPDVVIYRNPVSDEMLNASESIVEDEFARHTPLRQRNGGDPILHASVSCKWTIRSDRAQNARSEALNLIRNRKGKLPHIAVVTAEPLMSRIASLALGTGDIDCVYHIGLPELGAATSERGSEEAQDLFRMMSDGRRLRDISDLPFDLAV
ncbi:NgoMIV family type II restriction endonuclease [Brevundimonas sp. PAMC22021]|uniref:NgoMIV family type II restriction endonuclease n=1 Tax=Brevundimonas sp. PAMC22021 TaxID=2861285 RepID=UPI001C627FE6|nr:NgoMIV family type II restriction endonuclease [Brevundimonas sp. PAMC22021]QYF87195.1 NgoMIV family type II restriction endonuclease [Brevundimonas sp. PAMC22021]